MIRFGIVGFGLHAEKRLMPGFLGAERASVTALSRSDLARARETANQYGVPRAFDSTEELCSSDNVDAVLVTTPDALHLPDTLSAFEHALPVLCEKPMAMNGDQARRMVEASGKAHILLGIAQVFRFERSVQWFRDRVADGAIGRPKTARAEFFYPARQSPRTWIIDPEMACGGPIADVGVHCLDALRFVLSDNVVSVHATAEKDEYSGQLEATASLSLRFAAGVSGKVAVSARSGYRTFLEVSGEEGSIIAVNAFSVDKPVTGIVRRSGSVDAAEQVRFSNQDAYSLQVDAFAEAVEEGRVFEVPGEEGLENQLILDAAYRSVETGQMETV
jgi:1,5-anhydro-D-fructose reductase (1,5-anhydro-D-mannitol-forming)